MPQIQQLLGSHQSANDQFKVRCDRCDAVLVTSYSDRGVLVQEEAFNGPIPYTTGNFGFKTNCPSCGHRVVFPTGKSIADTTEW